MILFNTGFGDNNISINESETTNTGIEYVNAKNNLRHLKIKDRLLVKKYIILLNKLQMINYEDRFMFVEEQATAIELLIEIQSKPIFQKYKTYTIKRIESEIKILTDKLKNYENNNISEFERKKANFEKRNMVKEMVKPTDTDDVHKELVKIISRIYFDTNK